MPELLAPTEPISDELKAQEQIINDDLHAFMRTGRAFATISKKKLYKELGFSTFEEYVTARWGIQRMQAYRNIQAVAIIDTLPEGAIVPDSIGAAFALKGVDEKDRAGFYEQVLKDCGGRPTVGQVESAVRDYRKKKESGDQPGVDRPGVDQPGSVASSDPEEGPETIPEPGSEPSTPVVLMGDGTPVTLNDDKSDGDTDTGDADTPEPEPDAEPLATEPEATGSTPSTDPVPPAPVAAPVVRQLHLMLRWESHTVIVHDSESGGYTFRIEEHRRASGTTFEVYIDDIFDVEKDTLPDAQKRCTDYAEEALARAVPA